MIGDRIGDMNVEYAATVADGAIQSMAKQSVPATPNNFSVWFNYAMGASPALRKTIDILVGGKRKFDASVNHDLYVTYINPQSDSAGNDCGGRLREGIARRADKTEQGHGEHTSQASSKNPLPDR